MISGTLLKRNMVSCFKPFLIIFAVLCLYTLTIVYMYNPELADMLNEYQQMLPGMMSAVGMTGIAANLLEWMQIYLYGFFMILFPLIFIIILVQKLVMEYIDNGSVVNLLATPNSRGKIIRTQAFSVILWIIIMMTAITAVGIIGSQIMFPDQLDVSRYILLNGSTLLLQLVVAGIAFLTACVSSEAKNYYAFGAGIPLLFFVIQMMSNMGDKLEKLKYMTVYTLLPAAEVVKGESGVWASNLLLVTMAVLLFGGGIWWFSRRDLSV